MATSTVPQPVIDAIAQAEDSIAAASAADVAVTAATQTLTSATATQTAAHQKATTDSAAALAAVKSLLGLDVSGSATPGS